MLDVLIVGAGPAGSVAATILARAGARVRLVDRAQFPRDKLCGDTVNPGTLALLRRIGLAASVEGRGLAVEGMRLTGGNGVVVEGRYPDGLLGRAIVRRDVDWSLLSSAIAAGAQFESRIAARRAVVEEERGAPRVAGVMVGRAGGAVHRIPARVTIAADGRRSTIAFGLRLATHPPRPRRWAVGAYFADVDGLSTFGEMHVRAGRYIGVAAVPGGLTNVCLVRPFRPGGNGSPAGRSPVSALVRELERDPLLRDRFAHARLAQPPVVLGPLAVDVEAPAMDGLLLAGDAAGFVDPITGDGLRFAIRGGELAAIAALEALEHGWAGVHARLAARRRREFADKQRFNRALRVLVASPRAVSAAAFGARFAPEVFRRIIRKAGDCDLCQPS
jgi:flavin-dependent dehydrogenase